jgi:hypothetical protein
MKSNQSQRSKRQEQLVIIRIQELSPAGNADKSQCSGINSRARAWCCIAALLPCCQEWARDAMTVRGVIMCVCVYSASDIS